MSIQAYKWAWQQKGLKASERIVLLALAEFANETLTCWPSQTTLAKYCEIRRCNISTAIRKLVSKSLISVSPRGRGKQYQLNPSQATSYQKYLQGDHWQALRKQRLKLDKYRCQLCHTKGRMHVHHKHYKGGIYQTTVEDLITLCEGCHKHHHSKENPLAEVKKPHLRMVWREGRMVQEGST